ncbi:MAG: DUF3617 domain-containing protein, partial [Chthoniobacter sp.]|nr:DUF3617 domain-containing protein [Chthoniobacter sp.]
CLTPCPRRHKTPQPSLPIPPPSSCARDRNYLANADTGQYAGRTPLTMEETMGGGGATICISPEMAAKGITVADPQGNCKPEKIERSGNKISFEFHCTGKERTSDGKGENTVTGDLVHTRLDMTFTDAKGGHQMHSESEMTYVGADCKVQSPSNSPK